MIESKCLEKTLGNILFGPFLHESEVNKRGRNTEGKYGMNGDYNDEKELIK